MRTMFNRFALFPCMCTDCHKYIWLEKYRRANCWDKYVDRFLDKNLCKECIKKYR